MYRSFISLIFGVFACCFLVSCHKDEKQKASSTKSSYISRFHDERSLAPATIVAIPQTAYPWQYEGPNQVRLLTKEYFRCKGSNLHPPRIILQNGKETGRFYDCAGAEKHSLPFVEGKEFIYPVLIELLNEVQKQTGMPVIITSGHRCPAHNAYLDPRPKAQGSKHMIGAEVDFYVQDMQENPEKILNIIFDFYTQQPQFQGKKDYQTFSRFDKETDVSTQPWYNKEIFIKLYNKTEGRNFDNRHPYPYLSIQVRFDREKNERVIFSPERSQRFLRR